MVVAWVVASGGVELALGAGGVRVPGMAAWFGHS